MTAPRNNKPWLVTAGLSAIAIACVFTAPHEGTVYRAYPDPVTHGAPWTICEGHTRNVHPGDVATPAQCRDYLAADMRIAAQTVARCIEVPLNVNQAAALYDAVFNVGPEVVCGSTLQAKANTGQLMPMCLQLTRFDHAGGRQWAGLTTRRLDAAELCLTPPTNPTLIYPAPWKRS